MSKFTFDIKKPLLGSMEIEKALVLSAYLMIERSRRKVIDLLVADNVAMILNNDVDQGEELLNWLSKNPVIIKSQYEVYATPLFYTYQKTQKSIVIHANDNKFYSDLRMIFKVVDPTHIFFKYRYAAIMVSYWLLEDKQKITLTLQELRELLDLKQMNYKSFGQLDRILSRIRTKCKEQGLMMSYEKEPKNYAKNVVITIRENT